MHRPAGFGCGRLVLLQLGDARLADVRKAVAAAVAL